MFFLRQGGRWNYHNIHVFSIIAFVKEKSGMLRCIGSLEIPEDACFEVKSSRGEKT